MLYCCFTSELRCINGVGEVSEVEEECQVVEMGKVGAVGKEGEVGKEDQTQVLLKRPLSCCLADGRRDRRYQRYQISRSLREYSLLVYRGVPRTPRFQRPSRRNQRETLCVLFLGKARRPLVSCLAAGRRDRRN